MNEKEKKTSLFKLDCNIDGTYIDNNGEIKSIPDIIQVVGSTDGPAAYPSNVVDNSFFSDIELTELSNNSIDIRKNISTSGCGIIYDKRGLPIGYTGDLIFRDKNNEISLKNLIEKVNTIYIDGDDYFLRDKSLQTYNTSDTGISLDSIIDEVLLNTGAFGTGNIIQIARNYNVNNNYVSANTVELSLNNYVMIIASASVIGEGAIILRDVSTNTVLDTSYVKSDSLKTIPVYLSYFGVLSENLLPTVSAGPCDSVVWNTYLKRFFKLKNTDSLSNSHEIAVEAISGSSYTRASINIICFDTQAVTDVIQSGEGIINNETAYTVIFDTPMPSETYSISVQLNSNVYSWYADKNTKGFIVNFENKYQGNITWSAVYTELTSES